VRAARVAVPRSSMDAGRHFAVALARLCMIAFAVAEPTRRDVGRSEGQPF